MHLWALFQHLFSLNWVKLKTWQMETSDFLNKLFVKR